MTTIKNTLLLLGVGSGLFAVSTLQPGRLLCEYRVDPQGIDVTAPRLSWALVASDPHGRALRQAAYQVLVASSEEALAAGRGDLWNSGKVNSDQSIQVIYRGKPLASEAEAFWKVRVWDQAGNASSWSMPARWSMGLLQAGDWHGEWIGRDETGIMKDPADPYWILAKARWIWSGPPEGDRFFRAVFNVLTGRTITRAFCVAGADNAAEVSSTAR